MTGSTKFRAQSPQPGLKLIAGSFVGNDTSDPVATSNKGRDWKVVHTATGVYTVTLAGKPAFTQFLYGSANVSKGTAANWTANVRGVSTSAYTFRIECRNAGTLADPTTTDVVQFLVAVQDEGDTSYNSGAGQSL